MKKIKAEIDELEKSHLSALPHTHKYRLSLSPAIYRTKSVHSSAKIPFSALSGMRRHQRPLGRNPPPNADYWFLSASSSETLWL